MNARGQRPSRERASDVLTLAWTRQDGRVSDLARVVDGTCAVIYPSRHRLLSRAFVRYPWSAVLTIVTLLRHRPMVVIAQNPPVWPALIAYVFLLVRRGSLILDSHPASLGHKANRQAQLMMPITRFLARRSSAVLIASEHYTSTVQEWGAQPLVVHEPPLGRAITPTPFPKGMRADMPTVMFACVFAPDEPVAEVVAAARLTPHIRYLITGRAEHSPIDPADLPSNVLLTDYLPLEAFLGVMAACDAVLSLTDTDGSVTRSGYEATYLRRPLIASDRPAMRANFGGARFTGDSAPEIAQAVVDVTQAPPTPDELAAFCSAQEARWALQESALKRLVRRPQER